MVIRKMMVGGSIDDNTQDPKRIITGHNSVEIEMGHYNFRDIEDLKKIYDAVGISIFK